MTVVVTKQDALLVIQEDARPAIEVALSSPASISIAQGGPQGAVGPPGPVALNFDDSAKINGSVVYYDAASSLYKVDASVTVIGLTDGGNF